MKKGDPILGIPCDITNRSIRKAVHTVFGAISKKQRDWGRLRRRLKAIKYLDKKDDHGLVAGLWKVDKEAGRKWSANRTKRWESGLGFPGNQPEYWEHAVPGVIEVSRRCSQWSHQRLVALFAHECGHCVTRERDVERMDGCPYDEWTSELCADRYAFRWGFEKEIRKQAVSRDVGHHAALPGQILWLSSTAFEVDRHFKFKRRPDLDNPEYATEGEN